MKRYYVYLIISERRLVILSKEVDNEDYNLLIDSQSRGSCMIFCAGVSYGNRAQCTIVNSPLEFT